MTHTLSYKAFCYQLFNLSLQLFMPFQIHSLSWFIKQNITKYKINALLHISYRWKAEKNFIKNDITKFLKKEYLLGPFASLTTIANSSPHSVNALSTSNLVNKLLPSLSEGLGTWIIIHVAKVILTPSISKV